MFDLSNYDHIELLAGVDEVGRGPLAGPVVAAAVILDRNNPVVGLMDSKKLSHKRRVIFADRIKQQAISWSLGRAEVEEIDRINILQASLQAMKRAVEGLAIRPELVLVDGNHVPDIDIKKQAIIKGDSLVPTISAASIIAKVTRDNEMIEMDRQYPGYGFSKHKGYPTRQHITCMESLGISKIHRISFGPVARLIDK